MVFAESVPPVFCRHMPKAGISHGAGEVPQIEISAPVTLTFEGQHGVRPGVDATLNPAREVYAKERKFWIGHGINERAHQVHSLGNQIVIFPSKRHNHDFWFLACHPADAIAMQSGAIDNVSGGERPASRLDRHFRAPPEHFSHFRSGTYGSAVGRDNLRVFPRHCRVIRNSCARHQQSQQAAAVRLNFAQLFPVEHPHSNQSVGLAALQQFLETRYLFFAGGHDDLATDFMLQLVFAAEFHHGCGSLDAKLCLQGSRFVVNARVNDAAVVAALVTSDAVFFFDQQEPNLREKTSAVHRGRKTHDASADHYDVETLIRHNGKCRRHNAGVRFFIHCRLSGAKYCGYCLGSVWPRARDAFRGVRQWAGKYAMSFDDPSGFASTDGGAVSLPDAVHSTSSDILTVAASDPALTEDLALVLLKRSDLPAQALDQLSKNGSLMKSRKVKLAVVEHPRTPRHVSIPIVRHLFTFDLMQVALTPVVPADIKMAAEESLINRLETIPQGERLSLANRASGRVAATPLLDPEPRVVHAALENSRLTE